MLESPIQYNHSRAELIRAMTVLIWDEAPMANQAVLHCVDETCRCCTNSDIPFGGKIVILLGDFRQTAPVISGGSHAQVVQASIKSSSLWAQFKTFNLTIPIRNASDLPFSNFIDAIGDGAGPEIPLDMLQIVHSADEIIDFIFPSSVLTNPAECLNRAILAPLNQQVDDYNKKILSIIDGEEKTYFASDKLKEIDDAALPFPAEVLDYVAQRPPPGMPPHTLHVKTNAIFRLLRNLSIDQGLVKNTRVIVIGMGNHLIKIQRLRSNHLDDDICLLPQITFTLQLPSGYTLTRTQFPLAPSYATTFNSCQGMTLNTVGIDLTHPVFSHGQLYTALSRVRHRSHVKIRLPSNESKTTNVTFPELLLQ
jgi:PIF1-like helicase